MKSMITPCTSEMISGASPPGSARSAQGTGLASGAAKHHKPGCHPSFCSGSIILGIGSLMSTSSRLKTSPLAQCAFPVWVKASPNFPWRRSWNFKVETGFTALGMSPYVQQEHWWNAVVFDPGESLEALDEREMGYRRVLIPKHCLRPFLDTDMDMVELLQTHDCYVYVNDDPHYISVEGPSERYPLLQSYVDVCMGGALEYGEQFAKCFVNTTSLWRLPLYNDRAYPPERPMEQRRQIDSLLPVHLVENRTGQASFALQVQSKLEQLENLLEGATTGTLVDNVERAIIQDGMWSGRGPSVESDFRTLYAENWRGNHLNAGLVEGDLDSAIDWAKKASKAREPGSFKSAFRVHSVQGHPEERVESVLTWDSTYRSVGPFNGKEATGHYYQERHSNFYSWENGKVVWECGIWMTIDIEEVKHMVKKNLEPLLSPFSPTEAIKEAKHNLFVPFGFKGDLPTLHLADLDIDTFVSELRKWVLTPPSDCTSIAIRVVKHILDEEKNIGAILWIALGKCQHGTVIGTVHHSTVHWKYGKIARMENMWCAHKAHGEGKLRSFFRGSGWEEEFEKILDQMTSDDKKIGCSCPES